MPGWLLSHSVQQAPHVRHVECHASFEMFLSPPFPGPQVPPSHLICKEAGAQDFSFHHVPRNKYTSDLLSFTWN